MILLMPLYCCCWELSKKSTIFFLTKEDSVLKMGKNVFITKELWLYFIITHFKPSSHADSNSNSLLTLFFKKCSLFRFICETEIQSFLWNKQLMKSTTYSNQHGTNKTIYIPLRVKIVHIKPVIFVLGNQRYHSDSSVERYDLILTR